MSANISNSLMVDFLYQETINNHMIWERTDGGEFYLKGVKGVRVRLMFRERTASSICFKFEWGVKEAWILEPEITNTFALFKREYKTEGEKDLAQSMRQLVKAIESQHFTNNMRNIEDEEKIKKEVFNQFLYGNQE